MNRLCVLLVKSRRLACTRTLPNAAGAKPGGANMLHKYGVFGLVCRYNIRCRVKEGRKAD
jgi:hypothetical protein